MNINKAKTLIIALFAIPLNAQTSISGYQPGMNAEGAVYFLPKTAVKVTVQIEKTTTQPGEFAKYADRYLRLKDVPMSPSTSYRITQIRQQAVGVADTLKVFTLKFDARTSASNVALSNDGVLLAINATPSQQTEQPGFTPSPRQPMTNPRELMSAEILAAGSTAKMAELTAQDIYEIRESRNLLVRGQADNMPKDGAQLRLMLSQLEAQDRSLTSLFSGVTVVDTLEQTFTIIPNKEAQHELLFRFSKKLGMVDDDDLAGEPYYINVQNLRTVPMATPEEDNHRKRRQADGVYVNVPSKMKTVISDADGHQLSQAEMPAAQFGNVELLSGALFNKRYATHLWLNPVSGAVERLEAEQPK